jgi:hypothetical protein
MYVDGMNRREKHEVIYPELNVPDPSVFFNELKIVLRESKQWKLVPNQADFRAVVAEFEGPDFEGSGLAVSACVDDTYLDGHCPDQIMFAVMANSWGDSFKSANRQQLIEAFQLYRGIVRTTARHLRIPCRIQYPPRQLPYQLPPAAKLKLDAFCGLANRSCLHPYDWQRFYHFVRFCHAHSIKLGGGRLLTEMRQRGIPDRLAAKLAEQYAFGRSLLKGEFCGFD